MILFITSLHESWSFISYLFLRTLVVDSSFNRNVEDHQTAIVSLLLWNLYGEQGTCQVQTIIVVVVGLFIFADMERKDVL
jgi:hypothetical protein